MQDIHKQISEEHPKLFFFPTNSDYQRHFKIPEPQKDFIALMLLLLLLLLLQFLPSAFSRIRWTARCSPLRRRHC